MNTVAVAAFVMGAGIVLYVLVGYPLLLAALVRLRGPRPVMRKRWEASVSVILPVRNGAEWLAQKLDSILSLDYPRHLVEIIVIDDGSTDQTAAVAEAYAGQGVELLRIPAGGKAAALNAGLARARGDVLFFTDVRQRLDPRSLRVLVEHLADPAVGVVSGELVILEGESREELDIGLYWHMEKWIRKKLSALDSVPGATGCIYAMRRELAKPLPEDMLVDDMFLPLAALESGYRIIFAAEARAYDQPTALETEFWRKVRTLAGNYQIVREFPRLLLPTHRLWVHFTSHKLGRLMLPFALLAVVISTPWLPEPLRTVVLGVQVAVYGLAVLDAVLPARFPGKRVSSPARTFVVLMAATLIAPSVLLVGGRRFWKSTQVRHVPMAR
jgi:cellulose synthase/poly-beta-1,6-N-acetylglucosamine synthase-like glycosyltransferase